MYMQYSSRIILSLTLGFAIGCADTQKESKVPELSLSTSKSEESCTGNYFLYEGISQEIAYKALDGDLEASRQIVRDLPETLHFNDKQKCQDIFWLNIDAQNGGLLSMYELSLGLREDPFLCRRGSYWARKFIAQVDNDESFLDHYRDDVSLDEIKADIVLRKKQLIDNIEECNSISK